MVTIELLECGHPESEHPDFTRGYGVDNEGHRSCYECCAKRDRQQMHDEGRIALYLDRSAGKWTVSNWPGSLKITPSYVKRGRHNIAGSRYDVWFRFERRNWHGVTYGEMTQICHCRAVR
jgi:hypothetical protein